MIWIAITQCLVPYRTKTVYIYVGGARSISICTRWLSSVVLLSTLYLPVMGNSIADFDPWNFF